MSRQHQPKTVLVMGLKAGWTPDSSAPSAETTLAAVAEQQDRLKNFSVTLQPLTLDPAQPLAQHLSEVQALLDNNAYDGVSIGFGIRGNAKSTDVFTGLVNLVVEHGKTSDGKTPKLLFALAPNRLVEAVQSAWHEYA